MIRKTLYEVLTALQEVLEGPSFKEDALLEEEHSINLRMEKKNNDK
ncbi:MAG: hypothetical protein L6V81_06795 [Clostridium sp.]|nr:MAG: hypothetical protein L6V81_06795 [Clostridium sp.]